MPKPTHTVVRVSLPAPLVERTAAVARAELRTPSGLIAHAVRAGLQAPLVIRPEGEGSYATALAGASVKCSFRLEAITRVLLDKRAQRDERTRSATVAVMLLAYVVGAESVGAAGAKPGQ